MSSRLALWRAHALPCPAQSVNNYDKEVFNGDPGYIMSVDAAARRVRVRYPSSGPLGIPRILFHTPVQLLTGCTGCTKLVKSDAPFSKASLIRHACHSSAALTWCCATGSDKGSGRDVEYTGAELWEIELAWATTVHKAQGSESKAVVVVLSPAHRPLLTRRLFYTGARPPVLLRLASQTALLHAHERLLSAEQRRQLSHWSACAGHCREQSPDRMQIGGLQASDGIRSMLARRLKLA